MKRVSREAVSVYLDPKVKRWAMENALREGRSMSQFIERVLSRAAGMQPLPIAPPVFEPVQRPAPGWSPPAPGPTPGGRPADPLGRDLIP